MARIRYIKPDFFTDENIVELDLETRLLFIGLWTLADREGRLENKPKKIKMQLFPCDEVDVAEKLRCLDRHRMVIFYTIDNVDLIQIKNFAQHQRPHKHEAQSTLPAMPCTSLPGHYGARPLENGDGELTTGNWDGDGEKKESPDEASAFDSIWDEFKLLLIRQGSTESGARSKIAKLIQNHGKEKVTACYAESRVSVGEAVEAYAYFVGCLNKFVFTSDRDRKIQAAKKYHWQIYGQLDYDVPFVPESYATQFGYEC